VTTRKRKGKNQTTPSKEECEEAPERTESTTSKKTQKRTHNHRALDAFKRVLCMCVDGWAGAWMGGRVDG
jgi:hypothetical protein